MLRRSLVRLRRENEEHAYLSLKAIDYTGNLYFVDSETLKFRVFGPTSPLISSAFQTETKLRYIYDFEDIEIDNQDDLDPNLGTKADFDERIRWNQIGAAISLTYDINEDLRFSISNDLTYLRLTDTSFSGRRISRSSGAALTKTMKPPKRHGKTD